MESIYTFIIIVILAISLFISMKNHLGGSTPSVMKGYGKKDESIQVLLDRIQWSNHYPARLNIAARYGFYAVLISFFASIIYEPKSSTQNILQCTIIVWLILLGSHSFFGHHSDKFTAYFIDDNLNHLRNKLKVSSCIDSLSVNQTKFPGNHDCATFVYDWGEPDPRTGSTRVRVAKFKEIT